MVRYKLNKINRIYHHIEGGTIESHSSVQDFQSTRGLLKTGCCNSWTRITERFKLKKFNNCPNILHVDTDADAGGIAKILLY